MINKENIEKLNKLQERYLDLSEVYKGNEQDFRNRNKELIERIKEISDNITELKEELKIEGLEEYKETTNKKLTGGLSIRVNKSVEYDQEEAFSWAMSHKMCLSLDKTKFKKIAKVQELEFVDIIDKEIVCFPKELKLD